MSTKVKPNGQSLVEFSLILPILILLLLGIFEGGHIIQAYISAQNASREAARYAVAGRPYYLNGQPTDDPTGNPWTAPLEVRVEAIKSVAIRASRGTGFDLTKVITSPITIYSPGNMDPDYDTCKGPTAADDPDKCAGVLAVGLWGEIPNPAVPGTITEEANNSGIQGLNVRVDVYHNVVIWDPIYSALVPGGFVRVRASTIMRNEGVDITIIGTPGLLGGTPAPGGFGQGTPPPAGPGIAFLEGFEVKVNDVVNISLSNHAAGDYYLYFAEEYIGTITVDASGAALYPLYSIPPLAPGFYTLKSTLPGQTTPYAASTVQVVLSNIADIVINDNTSEKWPLGSPLQYRLILHTPPGPYPVSLVGPSPATLQTLPVDAEGNTPAGQEGNYIIPQSAIPGTYLFQTSEATRAVQFVKGCIKIDQGECNLSPPPQFPDLTNIKIHLEDHAANHSYTVLFDPGGPYQQEIDVVTTDGLGEYFEIPFFIPDVPNGSYQIQTLDGGFPIASTTIEVNTPLGPFIVVEGGYKWAAGSNIVFQLRNHEPGKRYDIYWEGTRVITITNLNLVPDASGTLFLDYDIPIDTPTGDYVLSSKLSQLDGGNPTGPDFAVGLKPIEVTGQPYLQIAEGVPQIPGATITLKLFNHNINAQYDLYIVVDGNLVKLPNSPVTTKGDGEASLKYVIPTTLDVGQAYPIRSYPRGNTSTVVAETTLTLAAPDLRITAIEVQAEPVFNVPMPITLTVENVSGVTITHRSFDVDVYIDPPLPPDLGRALPPGEIKLWLQPPILMNETRTVTAEVTLYGATNHELWGRADTSNRIIESIETNNLFNRTVNPATCQVEFTAGNLGPSTPFGDATSASFSVAGETITLQNNGSGGGAPDDNASGSGYQFVHQQVSGDFDVRVRVVSQSLVGGGQLNEFANFGLEVRASLDPEADKLQWLQSQGHRLLHLKREDRAIDTAIGLGPDYGGQPVWLRIVKSGSEFTLYHAPDSVAPPTTWTPVQTLMLPGLAEDVYLGLMNAPVSATEGLATFDGYHVCGGAGGGCGPLREASGLVIINGNNYIENVEVTDFTSSHDSQNYGTKKWETTTSGSKIGMVVPDVAGQTPHKQSGYETGSPYLRYEVDISNPGLYYVWFLANKPNANGDSLHFSPTASPAPANQYWGDVSTAADYGALKWFNNRTNAGPTVNVATVGRTSFSLWMREDGLEVYQILLTQNASFDPNAQSDPLALAQSACADLGLPPAPPGLQQCQAGIVNGNFEDTALMSAWNYSQIQQQVTRTSVPHWLAPGESFSMLLPDTSVSGLPRSPWLYQEFTLPTWVLTPTVNGGGQLKLKAHVGVNPEGSNEPDELFVSLLDPSGSANVTNPFVLATGADTPTINPFQPNNNDWILREVDLAKHFAPPEKILDYRGQDLRLYFSAPNAGADSTRFYLDNVSLEMCNTQPVPLSYSTKVAGQVRVLIDGIPTAKPGVFVWIYAIDGQMQKSYTIQDSTFSFYDLPATASGTTYILYAEYFEDGNFYSTSTVLLLKQGQSIENIALLLF